MHPRTLVQALSAGRIVLGASMILAPKLAMRTWIGDDVESARTRALIRSFGARDLAFGLGPLMAMRRGAPARGWVEAAAIGDLVDFAGTAIAFRHLPRFGAVLVLVTAAGALAAGLYAAPRLEQPTDERRQEIDAAVAQPGLTA